MRGALLAVVLVAGLWCAPLAGAQLVQEMVYRRTRTFYCKHPQACGNVASTELDVAQNNPFQTYDGSLCYCRGAQCRVSHGAARRCARCGLTPARGAGLDADVNRCFQGTCNAQESALRFTSVDTYGLCEFRMNIDSEVDTRACLEKERMMQNDELQHFTAPPRLRITPRTQEVERQYEGYPLDTQQVLDMMYKTSKVVKGLVDQAGESKHKQP